MSHHFRENREVYQGFILAHATLETPCYEAYEMACKIRNEELPYRDFEYIYMKFAAGQTELNVEVPMWTEEDKTFEKLPGPILRKVLSNVDVHARFTSRKVAKWLTELVDTTEHYCKSVYIDLSPPMFRLQLYDCDIRYDIESKNVYMERIESFSDNRIEDPFQTAMSDLKIIFKKLKIRRFSVNVSRYIGGKYEECGPLFLSTLQEIRNENQRPFKVDTFSIDHKNMASIITLLRMVKPSILKELLISSGDGSFDPEIFTTEQWQNLKKFDSERQVESINLMESFAHLEEFEAFSPLTAQHALLFLQALAASTTFKSCKVRLDASPMRISDFANVLNVQLESEETVKFLHKMKCNDSDDVLLISVKCSAHTDYFRLKVTRESSLG